jgi:hypothetical protein
MAAPTTGAPRGADADSMRHGGYRIRVVVEQVVVEDQARPGDDIEHVVVHEEATFAINDVDFSATLTDPIAAILDTMAYDVAPKMGDDLADGDRERRSKRREALLDAAAAVRGEGG